MGLKRHVWFLLWGWVAMWGQAGSACAQATVAHELTPAQRLALRQLDQLLESEPPEAVIDLLTRTLDEADGRLVPLAGPEDVFRGFDRYVPLTLYLNDRLLRWGVSRPEVLAEYRRRNDAVALRRLEAARESSDMVAARRLADRFLATSHGGEALRLVAELALRRGWYWTAVDALRRTDARWQVVTRGEPGAVVVGVDWSAVLPRVPDAQWEGWLDQLGSEPPTVSGWPFGCYRGGAGEPAEVGLQLVLAYWGAGERCTAERLSALLKRWYGTREVVLQGRTETLESALTRVTAASGAGDQLRDGAGHDTYLPSGMQDWPTLGHSPRRVYRTGALGGPLPRIASWRVRLPVTDRSPRVPPKEPPVGASSMRLGRSRELAEASEGGAGASTVSGRRTVGDVASRLAPIIEGGLLLAAVEREVRAWSVDTGLPWPSVGTGGVFGGDEADAGGLPLYQLEPVAEGPRRAGALPSDGAPWYSLSAADGQVVTRVGPAEAGWLKVIAPRLSQSRLVVMDVRREGQLLPGYPARLPLVRREAGVEFEGAPLLVGNRCYVGLNQRDEGASRASVGCFDVASGTLLFETPALGSSRRLVEGSAAHLVESFVSYREGLVYYQGGNGVVAAVDAEDGRLCWALRYPRAELDAGAYPRRARARRRRASPVALAGPLALVMAADLDRLLAVDATSGQLVWATSPGEADDVDQVLAMEGEDIVVGGDTLRWIDRFGGTVRTEWPASSTRQPGGGLPSPRRAGRGLVAGELIYWPVEDAIWVLPLRPGELGDGWSVARPVDRLELTGLGLRGGDLIAGRGVLVMSQDGELIGFVVE